MAVTQEQADRLVNKIKPIGLEIGKLADEGDKLCKNIMQWYSMWHRCPGDPGSYVVCEKYVDEYLARSK